MAPNHPTPASGPTRSSGPARSSGPGRSGPHVPSYYAATRPGAYQALSFAALSGSCRVDVAVIGGGFTGLSAALHLAEAGYAVALLEANCVGWGASGRNGGQLHTGQRRDQLWLEAHYPHEAKAFWRASLEARQLVLDLIDTYDIDAAYLPGHIYAAHRPKLVAKEHAYADYLASCYGYEEVQLLDRAAMVEALGTDRYFGGYRDGGGGHLHPLNLACGLAQAASGKGAQIYEATPVLKVDDLGAQKRLTTPTGDVTATSVLYAGNGYQHGLDVEAEARVLPIANYIAVTRPFGQHEALPIPGMESASDTRFVIYYWRVTPDRRLLFGGGETYTRSGPKDVAGFVRRHLSAAYPQYGDCQIDYAWGGTLGITASRLPFIRRLSAGRYAAMGYSGHGVGTSIFAGRLVARAIQGDCESFDLFAKLQIAPFPGGTRLRLPLMMLAMTWAALNDRLGL